MTTRQARSVLVATLLNPPSSSGTVRRSVLASSCLWAFCPAPLEDRGSFGCTEGDARIPDPRSSAHTPLPSRKRHRDVTHPVVAGQPARRGRDAPPAGERRVARDAVVEQVAYAVEPDADF